MNAGSERMRILEMIESGRITAAEGVRLLESLNLTDNDEEISEVEPLSGGLPAVQIPLESAAEEFESLQPEQHDVGGANRWTAVERSYAEAEFARTPTGFDAKRFRSWWVVPLWIGLGVVLFGGALAAAAVLAAGALSIGFLCALLPVALGVLLLIFAWIARSAAWLHLRVQQAPGEKPERIAISFPLPIGPASWFLRVFGDFIPGIDRQTLDQLLFALKSGVGPDQPIHIQVDEGEGREKVEIYIG